MTIPLSDHQSTASAHPPKTSWSCRSSSQRTGAAWRSAWTARSSSTTSSATAGATWPPNVPVRTAGPTPSTCPTPVLPTTNPQNGLSKRFRIRSVWNCHGVLLPIKMLPFILFSPVANVPDGNALMLHTVWKIRPLLLALQRSFNTSNTLKSARGEGIKPSLFQHEPLSISLLRKKVSSVIKALECSLTHFKFTLTSFSQINPSWHRMKWVWKKISQGCFDHWKAQGLNVHFSMELNCM